MRAGTHDLAFEPARADGLPAVGESGLSGDVAEMAVVISE